MRAAATHNFSLAKYRVSEGELLRSSLAPPLALGVDGMSVACARTGMAESQSLAGGAGYG